MIKASERFVSLATLTRWIVYALYAAIVLSLVGAAFDLNEYRVLAMMRDSSFSDADSLQAQAEFSDLLMGIQGVADFSLQVVLYFIIARWIYRAAWNTKHLGANMTISPGWAIGWYFIPFACLIRPFTAMREIWEGSHSAAGATEEAKSIAILRWWWALFLATSFIGNALLRAAVHNDSSVSALIATNVGTTLLDFLAVPLDIVFIAIVRRVTRAQDLASPSAVISPTAHLAPSNI